MTVLRPYQTQIVDDCRAEDKRERQRLATARWRAAHPDANKASQDREDAKPERKEAKRLRARVARRREDTKKARREYLRRPEIRARINNSEGRRASMKAWRSTPEAKAARAAKMRALRQQPKHCIENRIRSAIRRGLTSKRLPQRWAVMLGYDADALCAHLERQFLPGMSWSNIRRWHLDHIRPLSSFSIVEAGDPEFLAAWALSNLRPLWADQNIAKGAKLEGLL